MPTCSVYAGNWPHERKAWLRRATDVAWSFEYMGYGKFQLELAAAEAQHVQPDDLIGIRSAYGLPDFLAWVDRIEQSAGGAYITVSGREWASVLGERSTQQERTYPSGDAAAVAADIIRRASARNNTGIAITQSRGTPLSGPFTVRADSVLSALGDLVEVTADEWVIRYSAASRAEAWFEWQPQPRMRAHSVHLMRGQIARADYVVDAISDAAVVQVVGSLGNFGERPSAVATEMPLALQDIASVRVSTNRQRRRTIATSRELSIVDASLPDSLGAQRKAISSASAILAGQEAISVTASTAADWRDFALGGVITVRLAGVDFGGDVVRPFRILGIQPVEDRGLCELVGRVYAAA